MINFSIHIGSVIVGFILGLVICSVAGFMLFYDNRWDHGFGEGWECCRKYGEKLKEEKD